ncbi:MULTISPECIES: cytochrome c oxidase subunit II [unclassified Tolypothrix]|uniref:cytochrome c oxidase subunit II n=1 Tax=unclassified Tolypothrix TaxID=2649714 RepID=UPI0005EAACB4|nr:MULTISPECIES: cytochrome c oxidase subunit II [unclassified Tolypothrix]BAY88186.1 cytochrome c oxidase subunit II [Microchaete diplosiphon NIES-3275]EKF02047.1 cytochrome c oxidase subunit [Tolypothrix sp. PCC 7601]MBE9085640.1 cytochrome c oxidase subunit II [Tolypothrix sp. LEGE 11397]UYD28888.1 cytochrome c oxidase subunit II [Tolypothrix sp. PCC 7712]UYD35200.1 cytochrome c oxidase subunit II [Tolypothrix sp. PCC 7601]
MKQIPLGIITLIAGILITLISLWVGQNNHLLPVQASAQAPLVDDFFNVMVAIGTALFLVVQGAILFSVIKFRRRPGDNGDGLPIEGSFPLEILWTIIPGIIVIGLGVYSVDVYTEMGGMDEIGHHGMTHESMMAQPESNPIGIGSTPATEGKPPSLVVNVTGMQYAWLFNYPDSDVNTGELHVPIGQDVLLNISANDVIHSFWVPQFRLKQDAIPGQPTQLRFTATKTGTYPIVCAELCGGYHGSMRTSVVVHTPEDYDRWLAENRVAQQPEMDQTVAVNP